MNFSRVRQRVSSSLVPLNLPQWISPITIRCDRCTATVPILEGNVLTTKRTKGGNPCWGCFVSFRHNYYRPWPNLDLFVGCNKSGASIPRPGRSLSVSQEFKEDDETTVLVPPEPTWSLRQLRLTPEDESSLSSHATSFSTDDKDREGSLCNALPSESGPEEESISEEDMRVFASRCLVDVDYYGEEEVKSLRRSVGGMMRCLSVIAEEASSAIGDAERVVASPEEMYDLPPGTKAPTRNDDDIVVSREEAGLVMESIRNKLTEVDGQIYFSIHGIYGRGSKNQSHSQSQSGAPSDA